MADAGQTPGTNQTLADQPLEKRADMLDKSRIERHAASSVRPLRYMTLVRDHIRMEKEQIEARQSQASEASFDRLPQERFNFLRRRIAEIAFAGDPDVIRQAPSESFTDDPFCPAITVARRQVDQVDPGRYCLMHGGDAFVERGFTPHHADATTTERQR